MPSKIKPQISYFVNIQSSYMRIFSGRPEELKSAANFLTDAIELRSNSIALIFAEGFSLIIVPWTSLVAAMFLTPITTWTPRNARTLAVSFPIPLDAPEILPTYDT